MLPTGVPLGVATLVRACGLCISMRLSKLSKLRYSTGVHAIHVYCKFCGAVGCLGYFEFMNFYMQQWCITISTICTYISWITSLS